MRQFICARAFTNSCIHSQRSTVNAFAFCVVLSDFFPALVFLCNIFNIYKYFFFNECCAAKCAFATRYMTCRQCRVESHTLRHLLAFVKQQFSLEFIMRFQWTRFSYFSGFSFACCSIELSWRVFLSFLCGNGNEIVLKSVALHSTPVCF